MDESTDYLDSVSSRSEALSGHHKSNKENLKQTSKELDKSSLLLTPKNSDEEKATEGTFGPDNRGVPNLMTGNVDGCPSVSITNKNVLSEHNTNSENMPNDKLQLTKPKTEMEITSGYHHIIPAQNDTLRTSTESTENNEKPQNSNEACSSLDNSSISVNSDPDKSDDQIITPRYRVKKAEEAAAAEIRYEKLLNLLSKSESYSSFIEQAKKRIENKNKKKRKRQLNDDSATQVAKRRKEMILLQQAAKNKKKIKSKLVDEDVDASSSALTKDEIGGQKRFTPMGFEVDEDQPVLLEGGILRDYQLAGFKWLKLMFESGMNGILADEMGLGKTVQTIALICYLYEQNVIGPFLIVAPLSTVPNWLLEFERFCPQIPTITYHGSIAERKIARDNLVCGKHKLNGRNIFPVVITSYEMPIQDRTHLQKYYWKYIIVDEGHRLKNDNTILSRTLRTFHTTNKLLLTGTPIQNSLRELWALLNFLLPDIFDSLDAFETWLTIKEIEACSSNSAAHLIEQEKKNMVLEKIHKILAPFLLRRTKVDVELTLPPKKEVVIKCPLTDTQLVLYRGVVSECLGNRNNYSSTPDTIVRRVREKPQKITVLEKEARVLSLDRDRNSSTNSMPITNTFTYLDCPGRKNIIVEGDQQYLIQFKMASPHWNLKKIVNHPFLVKTPVLPGSNIFKMDNCIITESGKMIILDSLLTRLKARGHKVIIFSTMTTMLDYIEDYLCMKDFQYGRLDGSDNLAVRKDSIFRFNTDPDVFTFLVSTRAGGLGINLCAADTVIIFDSDWNPQVDIQAQDRCHRIGQTKPVIVYKLFCPGTIDEHVIIKAHAKRKLEKIIIQKGSFGNKNKLENIPLEDLKAILEEKISSKEVVIGCKDLTEEQWSKILDRSDLLTPQE